MTPIKEIEEIELIQGNLQDYVLHCVFQHDLCGYRGLEPGSDQQTFEVTIPMRMRNDYNKVLLQANTRVSTDNSILTAN